jgi:hypothetical protein
MKPFILLKLPVVLLGFGAFLALSPVCKAQSEVSPDRFDGTDSWVAAAQKPVPAAKAKPATTTHSSLQAQNGKADSGPTIQLAAAREVSKPTKHEAVAVQDKRKTAPRKPDNE